MKIHNIVFAFCFCLIGCSTRPEPQIPVIIVQMPETKSPDVKKAEDIGAYVAGETYSAGKKTYEYLSSEETKEKISRAKAFAKQKIKQGLEAGAKAIDASSEL